ncbi:Uncharacterised protein [uncultured archaeon]|nr:Uncharacterised protein [uncultured archaeon]
MNETKYLFGDSTESQLKRDFLALLDNYVDTCVKAITLENSVFQLKEDIMDRRKLKNTIIEQLDMCLLTSEQAISNAVATSKEKTTITQYAAKGREFLKKYIDDGKVRLSEEVFKEISDFDKKVNFSDKENRAILETFFIHDPLNIIQRNFIIKATKDGFAAKVKVDFEGDISVIYGIASSQVPFWNRHVRVSDFIKGIEIPARMKKPLLKKEETPDIVVIDDYLVTDVVQVGNELEVIIRKRMDSEAERFRFKMVFKDQFAVEVYHAEEKEMEKYIQAIPAINALINPQKLRELGEKIIARLNTLYPKKRSMESLHFNKKDVFEQNLVFELLNKIAEIYAPTIAQIKKHTPSLEELSLKVEDESGKRSEIYLKKSKVKEKLATIKEKGDVILKILDI